MHEGSGPRYTRISGKDLRWKKIAVPGFGGHAWYARLNYAQWVRLLELTEGTGEFITIAVPEKPDVDGNRIDPC